jgi:hypothetical protein
MHFKNGFKYAVKNVIIEQKKSKNLLVYIYKTVKINNELYEKKLEKEEKEVSRFFLRENLRSN